MRGGEIQDHLSAPCNATFPKCDEYYFSSDAYKCKVANFKFPELRLILVISLHVDVANREKLSCL